MLAGDSAGVVEVHGVASWRLALMIRLHRFVDRIPFCTWTVKQEKKSETRYQIMIPATTTAAKTLPVPFSFRLSSDALDIPSERQAFYFYGLSNLLIQSMRPLTRRLLF